MNKSGEETKRLRSEQARFRACNGWGGSAEPGACDAPPARPRRRSYASFFSPISAALRVELHIALAEA